jgi:hypothetical protein
MPEKLFAKLTEIIKSDFKGTTTGGALILQDSSSLPVTINKTGKILYLKTDTIVKSWKNNFPFYDESVSGLCSIGDCMLVYPQTDSLYIFIIELKTANTTGAFQQLLASFELSKYFCGTAQRLLKNRNAKVHYRGIVFSQKLIVKGTTKPKLKYEVHPTSGFKYMHKQSGQSINLNVMTF